MGPIAGKGRGPCFGALVRLTARGRGARRFQNSSNDAFESDVTALAQSGGFQMAFAVTTLQHMSSNLVSQIKSLQPEQQQIEQAAGSAKLALKSGVERMLSLPSALTFSSSFSESGDLRPKSKASPQSHQLQYKVSHSHH